MNTLSIITTIFTAPVGWNIAIGCFVAAATCMAVNYHQRIVQIQKHNAEIVVTLKKIIAIAEEMPHSNSAGAV